MNYPLHDALHSADGNPALLDTATGALSRAAFILRLEEAGALAARLGHGVSVVVVDVAEPAAGHGALPYGPVIDGVLGALVDRMWSLARRSDTVARIGGDRLALLLPATHRRGAERLAGRLETLLAAPCITEHGAVSVAVQVRAVGTEPGQPVDASELLYTVDSVPAAVAV